MILGLTNCNIRDERKPFHCIVENVTYDKTIYNRILETSHVLSIISCIHILNRKLPHSINGLVLPLKSLQVHLNITTFSYYLGKTTINTMMMVMEVTSFLLASKD